MELEQILALITPFISGAIGILGAIGVFVSRISALKKTIKGQMTDNETIKTELENTRQALSDLSTKVNYVVEEAKKRGRENQKK